MERRMNGEGGGVVAALVAVLVLANGVNAQIYTCWGGCFNDCFLRSIKTVPEKLFCYYHCLAGCFPHSAVDYRHYCRIGCSLDQCSPLRYNDGGRMEACFQSKCSNLCN